MDAPPLEKQPAKILIIDTAWIGDVIFSTALLAASQSTWPACEVDFLVAPRGEAVLRGHESIRHLLILDKAGAHSSLSALLRYARELNERKYDIVLCAHPSPRSRILCAQIDAPVRVGYRGLGAALAFTHTVSGALELEPDHVQRRLNLLRAVGVELTSAPPLNVTVTAENDRDAQNLRRELKTNEPLLGLIVGSAWETKRWTPNGFAELAELWNRQTGGQTLIIAGTAERDLCARIEQESGRAARALVQQPLGTLRAVLRQCRAVVGNDTGLTYLALAVGCPHVVALYGSTQLNYAFPPPHHALSAGMPCCLSRYGHGKHHCRWKDSTAWCMEQIAVESVWDALRATLE